MCVIGTKVGQGHPSDRVCSDCTTVHNNVAVAAIVSKILPFQNFLLNVCQCHKSRSRSPNVIL